MVIRLDTWAPLVTGLSDGSSTLNNVLVSDGVDGAGLKVVKVTLDGATVLRQEFTAEDPVRSYTVNYTPQGLAAGDHVYTVYAWDLAGNYVRAVQTFGVVVAPEARVQFRPTDGRSVAVLNADDPVEIQVLITGLEGLTEADFSLSFSRLLGGGETEPIPGIPAGNWQGIGKSYYTCSLSVSAGTLLNQGATAEVVMDAVVKGSAFQSRFTLSIVDPAAGQDINNEPTGAVTVGTMLPSNSKGPLKPPLNNKRYTNETDLTLEFDVSGAEQVWIDAGGSITEVPEITPRIVVQVALPNEGDNVVTVHAARDGGAVESTNSMVVVLDTVPPQITLVAPDASTTKLLGYMLFSKWLGAEEDLWAERQVWKDGTDFQISAVDENVLQRVSLCTNSGDISSMAEGDKRLDSRYPFPRYSEHPDYADWPSSIEPRQSIDADLAIVDEPQDFTFEAPSTPTEDLDKISIIAVKAEDYAGNVGYSEPIFARADLKKPEPIEDPDAQQPTYYVSWRDWEPVLQFNATDNKEDNPDVPREQRKVEGCGLYKVTIQHPSLTDKTLECRRLYMGEDNWVIEILPLPPFPETSAPEEAPAVTYRLEDYAGNVKEGTLAVPPARGYGKPCVGSVHTSNYTLYNKRVDNGNWWYEEGGTSSETHCADGYYIAWQDMTGYIDNYEFNGSAYEDPPGIPLHEGGWLDGEWMPPEYGDWSHLFGAYWSPGGLGVSLPGDDVDLDYDEEAGYTLVSGEVNSVLLSPRVYISAPIGIPCYVAEGEEPPLQETYFPALLKPREVYASGRFDAEALDRDPQTARMKSEDAEISKDGDKVTARFKAPENAQPGLWPVTMTFNAKAGDWDGADIAAAGVADFAAKGNLTIVEPNVLLAGQVQKVKLRGWFVNGWDGKQEIRFSAENFQFGDGDGITVLSQDAFGNDLRPRLVMDDPFNHRNVHAVEMWIAINRDVPAGFCDLYVSDQNDELSTVETLTVVKNAVAVIVADVVGACRFGSVHRGSAIPLLADYQLMLNATHLLIPEDCRIDAGEFRNYAVIQVDKGKLPEFMLKDENGVPCTQVRSDMFEKEPALVALLYLINLIRSWGGLPEITPDEMYRDFMDAFKIPSDEAEKGIWWIAGAYSTEGRQPAILFYDKLTGKRIAGAAPIKILVEVPIKIIPVQSTVRRFEKFEAELILDNDYFHHLGTAGKGMTQQDRFDAYDADGDGEKIIVDARFRLMSGGEPDEVVTIGDQVQVYGVPCFCMKEESNTPFKWKVRFSPPHETTGTQYWELSVRAEVWHNAQPDQTQNYDELNNADGHYYHRYGYNEFGGNGHSAAARFYTETDPLTGAPYEDSLPVPRLKFRCDVGQKAGPIRTAKAGENSRYLYHLRPEAGNYNAKPFFALAMAKPWDRQYSYPSYASGWEGMDIVDRSQLCAQLKSAGLNFNYVWFAPWECQLVHNRARSEFWYENNVRRNVNGETLVPVDEWTGYGYYDQGRAARMDETIRLHEANDIYVALSVWPHQSLQHGEYVAGQYQGHPWRETGWRSKERDEEENGFSSLDSDIDNFFAAADDTASVGWLWQQNLYRYIVARWGYSRAIAVWVIIDELEGVGNTTTYWWNNNGTTYTWHDEIVKSFRGFDWLSRPMTTSTTFWNYDVDPYKESEEPGHGDWVGHVQTVDLLSHHAYHKVYFWKNGALRNGQTNDYGWSQYAPYLNLNNVGDPLEQYQAPIWYHLCGRMYRWVENTSARNTPWLVTEYGLFERRLPSQIDSPEFQRRLARSYLHFAVWSAFSTGHMGTPLKWCDGLNYGEMLPRGTGPFRSDKYPDLTVEMAPLRDLLSQVDIGQLATISAFSVTQPGGAPSTVRCWGLKSGTKAILWLFDDDFDQTQGPTWGQSARTYADAQAASKQNHVVHVAGLVGGRAYTVRWYNTWDGGPTYRTETLTASGAGEIDIPVGTLATTARAAAEAWDGADAVLIVEQVEG